MSSAMRAVEQAGGGFTQNGGSKTMVSMIKHTSEEQELAALPRDLKRYLADGRLDRGAVIRLARYRRVQSILWSLAEQAGLADQLDQMLA